jgi:hypothetical protein
VTRVEGRKEEVEAAADEQDAEEEEDGEKEEDGEAVITFFSSNAAFLAAGACTAGLPQSPSTPPPLLSRARFGAPAPDDAAGFGVLLVLDDEIKNAESLGCVIFLS